MKIIWRIINNLKANILVIFLGGVFVALLCGTYNIVVSDLSKFKYDMVYKATLECTPKFNQNDGKIKIDEYSSKTMLFTQDFYDVIANQVEEFDSANEYVKNIDLRYENNIFFISYCSEDLTIAKDSVRAIFKEFEKRYIDKGYVEYIEESDNISTERIKKMRDVKQKLGVTQVIELGMIVGMIIIAVGITISYLLKKNIVDEDDAESYLDLPVLAVIPSINAKGENNEQINNQ